MIFSSLEFNNNEPIYLQIENYIKYMIKNNMVVTDAKLPSSRDLSKILGVSRNSVIVAYENLEADGIVYTIKGRGTFVSKSKEDYKNGWNLSWDNMINSYGRLAEELDIVKTEIPWEKGMISFKSISPDGALFDIDEFKKSFLNRISLEEDKILNYGYAQGYKPLIDYLLEYMKQKGVSVENKDIIITNGFTEGLEMILDTFCKSGDKILCENPTHNKIKFGYLIPSYHNPTGIVMKAEKRQRVYNLFRKYNIPIIEDGFNEELLYNSTHISPLSSIDKGGNGVIYISSFSKILFPGLRVGWILADKRIIDVLESVKRCKNIHTSFLDQGILYEYLNSGAFDKNVKRIRKVYREKYDFALNCINKYIKPDFIWGEGALHIYIGIEGVKSRELLKECYKKNVIFTPGDIFSVDNSCENTLRIGLTRLNLEQIEEGIRIIGEKVKELRERIRFNEDK